MAAEMIQARLHDERGCEFSQKSRFEPEIHLSCELAVNTLIIIALCKEGGFADREFKP